MTLPKASFDSIDAGSNGRTPDLLGNMLQFLDSYELWDKQENLCYTNGH